MLDSMPCDWAETTVVEAPTPFACTADLMLGDSLGRADQRHEFRRRTMTAPAANWRMHDVTLHPTYALVFKDEQIVPNTRYCVNDREAAAAEKQLTTPHRRLAGRQAFLGFGRYCMNHCHIVTQIVPAVAAYQTEPGFRDGVLLRLAAGPNLHNAQVLTARALQLAGIALPEVLVIGPSPMDATDLTFSSFLTGCKGPSLFCQSVFDRMIEAAIVLPGATWPRLIYISRTDALARPMRNEEALMTMLDRYGVLEVVLSSLCLDEQIAMFRNAALVIGPHGAGLANVVFGSPGTVLYELLPEHYINPYINQLAQQRGMHYWCDVHKAEDKPGVWHHQVSWSVDIDAVERRLVEILSYYNLDAHVTSRGVSPEATGRRQLG
jgi:hypothetical protein